jgi:cellulose synthase/poly-beta-1,6-N-acetylglucosamine synthase-like glycosyltransferase
MAIADNLLLQVLIFGILGLYALFLFLLLVTLMRSGSIKESSAKALEGFAVVIPFKNESARLQDLIEKYDDTPFAVIFINDHSTDLSRSELDRMFKSAGLPLLHLPDSLSGKKAAIYHAAELIEQPWILTSDADTVLNREFVIGIPSFLKPEKAAYVLPVRPSRSSSLVAAFFDLEFLILQAVGCATAALGFPLLSNGAAFLFRKDAYMESMQYRTDLHIESGDDVFTLHAIAEVFGAKSVGLIMTEGPAADADFPEGANALWRQRLRWIGKAGAVKDRVYQMVIWLVFAVNALFVLTLIEGFITGDFRIFGGAVLLKIAGEIFLTAWGVSYFRRADCLRWALPAVFIYPFYFFALLITAVFYKPRWKTPTSEPVD